MVQLAATFGLFFLLALLTGLCYSRFDSLGMLVLLQGAAGMVLLLSGLLLVLRRWRYRAWVVMPPFIVFLLVYIGELSCAFATGRPVCLEVLCNVTPENLRMGVRLFSAGIIGGMLILLAGIALYAYLYTRKLNVKIAGRTAVFFLVSGLVLTLFCSPLTKLAGLFGDIWLQYRIQMLDPEAYAGLGIKINATSRQDIKAKPGRNLVFIFLESLARTHCDDNVFPGLTPNINRLRKEAICFDNNDNAPNADYSFGGMYAALTGSVLINQHLSAGLNGGVNPHIGSRLSSFPWILHKAGYRQVFILGPEVKFAGVNVLLNREGFDEAISCGDNSFEAAGDSWGCSDRELFEYALPRYRELVASGQPFHLMLYTIDTHVPDGFLKPSALRYPAEPGGPRLLHAIYNTDHEVGRFIERLKDEPGWENTCVVFTSDHLATANSLSARLDACGERRHLCFALNAGAPKIISERGMTFDLAPTVLALLGVEHNFTFPLGENLLEPANPERLKRERAHAEAIRSYTLLNSDLVLDRRPEISVRTSPVHMLNIGGVSFPLYLRQPAVQGLPDKEHCLVLRLSPFRRIAEATWCSDAGWIEEISRGTKDSDQYIVFGQSAGPAGRLPGAAGKKTWILGFGKQGKWICSTGDEVEALKVTGDLTLNRE